MDAFFAAIEQLDRPELRGRPVLVGHDGPRGVVTTASYEARPFGCHSAQPMAVAQRLCPHAVIVPVRGERYRRVSRQVFELLETATPVVEPLSIDEAFLDVTGCPGDGETIARRLKRRILETTGLTASIGVAGNKFLAKLASDLDKPDGLTVISDERIDEVLLPLPVGAIWGLGGKAAARLEREGVRTIGDLRRLSEAQLRRRFGAMGERFYRLARGLDDRSVTPDHRAKSIGHEQTFGQDLVDPSAVRAVLLEQVEQVARRLRRQGLAARAVTLKVRFGEFETITRATTLPRPTDVTAELWRAAAELFDRWAAAGFRPVRLIGVQAGRLGRGEDQLALFAQPGRERQRRLDAALDGITARFGKRAVHRGTRIQREAER